VETAKLRNDLLALGWGAEASDPRGGSSTAPVERFLDLHAQVWEQTALVERRAAMVASVSREAPFDRSCPYVVDERRQLPRVGDGICPRLSVIGCHVKVTLR
jgi:hypothetical protein